MKTRTFKLNKLVRDKIIQSTEAQGGKVTYRQLKGKELRRALVDKLIEEAQELQSSRLSAEELADIKELLIALRETLKIHAGELEDARRKKADTNGRFKKGYYIEELTLPADNKWAKYYAKYPERFPEVRK
jgi:predicted house-cleaning noncanonical NTP pyrophosphatase (MazG superfamily)